MNRYIGRCAGPLLASSIHDGSVLVAGLESPNRSNQVSGAYNQIHSFVFTELMLHYSQYEPPLDELLVQGKVVSPIDC